MSEDNLDDKQTVYFLSEAITLQPGETELHKQNDRLLGRSLEDVKEDWKKVSEQVSEMIEHTKAQQPKGFALETVSVSLGFSAKGRLVFIAEAGVEASVEMVFKRSE
jgi:hypothetical protein